MVPKNCPDPRNCSKIHYFGRCPYKHQACSRGTACSYVNQNNCQFYHPEGDYPQYQAKKAAISKNEKQKSRTVHLKIVPRPTRSSVEQTPFVASKAYAVMAGLEKKKTTTPSTLITPSPPSKNNKLIQPPVRIVQSSPPKEVPIPPIQKKVTKTLGEKLNKPRIPDSITRINEQQVLIRGLESRIRKTWRTVEYNRERAAALESSTQRFFSWWSRAVRTLELIRESGVLLDENIAKVIDNQSAALRRHDKGCIYVPGLADLNPIVRKTSHLQHYGFEDHSPFNQERDRFFQYQHSNSIWK